MTSLLPKVSSEHSSQEPSKLSPLSSLSLSLSPPPPLSLLPDLFFLLRISHLFSLRGTQPTPVLSVPILHPCSPHTALWRMQECWLVVCSSRSKSHPFPSSPAPGKPNLALWLLVRLGSAQHMQKIGGLENREMGGAVLLSFPQGFGFCLVAPIQPQFSLQVLLIITSLCPLVWYSPQLLLALVGGGALPTLVGFLKP